MQQYILKRLLFFIPSLIIITLIAFIINSCAPGDPVSRMLGGEPDKPESLHLYKERYMQLSRQLGLDLPLFYISVHPLALDADFSIINKQHRDAVKALALQYGNPDAAINFYLETSQMLRADGNPLVSSYSKKTLDHLISNDRHEALNSSWVELKSSGSFWKKYIPVIRFNLYNQYHQWMFGDGGKNTSGIINGDFGRSWVTGKKVSTLLSEKIAITIFFSIAGLLIAFAIGTKAGVVAGRNKDSVFDKASNAILMLIHSVPAFFIATCLLFLFANTSVLALFPASGLSPVFMNEEAGLAARLIAQLPYVILPLFAYILGTLPFLTRTVRSGMIDEMQKDYILTAKAKGLDKVQVSRHALRNTLIPLITILAYVFPALIGGSAILETVFSIPGMGLEIISAIFNKDYPVIIAVFTITGLLSVTGFLLSDILYVFADPKIRLT